MARTMLAYLFEIKDVNETLEATVERRPVARIHQTLTRRSQTFVRRMP
jgi:hypothetical protein